MFRYFNVISTYQAVHQVGRKVQSMEEHRNMLVLMGKPVSQLNAMNIEQLMLMSFIIISIINRGAIVISMISISISKIRGAGSHLLREGHDH